MMFLDFLHAVFARSEKLSFEKKLSFLIKDKIRFLCNVPQSNLSLIPRPHSFLQEQYFNAKGNIIFVLYILYQ